MSDIVEQLKEPESNYPGNFDTPKLCAMSFVTPLRIVLNARIKLGDKCVI